MKFIRSCGLFAFAAVTYGASFAQFVGVYVTPDGYEVGQVWSKLATPVVDEVVRQSPSRVVVLVCTATPPAKVIQFETELNARHKVPVQVFPSEKACPTKGPHAGRLSELDAS